MPGLIYNRETGFIAWAVKMDNEDGEKLLAQCPDDQHDIIWVPADHLAVTENARYRIEGNKIVPKLKMDWTLIPSTVYEDMESVVEVRPLVDDISVFIETSQGYRDVVHLSKEDCDIELPGFDVCKVTLSIIDNPYYYDSFTFEVVENAQS